MWSHCSNDERFNVCIGSSKVAICFRRLEGNEEQCISFSCWIPCKNYGNVLSVCVCACVCTVHMCVCVCVACVLSASQFDLNQKGKERTWFSQKIYELWNPEEGIYLLMCLQIHLNLWIVHVRGFSVIPQSPLEMEMRPHTHTHTHTSQLDLHFFWCAM